MKVCFYGEICDISHSYVDDILHNNIELSTLENADVVIFTGCGYEKTKIEYSASTLEDVIKKMKKGAKLGVFGCVTAYDDFYNQYRGRSEIDYIGRGTGLEMQNEIKQYLASNSVNVNATGVGFYLTFKKRLNLIIQDGCNNRCAFCKSNYLDLHLHSRPMDSILKLIDDMHKTTGIDEINIMGLNPSQYGLDLYGTRSLDKLIQKISALDYINTIFLDMLCISDITNDLLLEIISNPKIKRVMIPIQSLDNELLKRMGRNNDARRAIEIFNVISKNRPDIFLETIFLACYPTESEKNIKLNMAFLDTFNIGNSLISVYKYGSNVASLKSENIESRTREKHLEMLSYYEYFIVPKIEQQREKLLSQQVIGRLIERDEQFDYYSTNFRFVTREYVIKCPRDDNNKMYEWYEISTDMLQRNGKIIYDVEGREGNGRVLRRVSNKNNV